MFEQQCCTVYTYVSCMPYLCESTKRYRILTAKHVRHRFESLGEIDFLLVTARVTKTQEMEWQIYYIVAIFRTNLHRTDNKGALQCWGNSMGKTINRIARV